MHYIWSLLKLFLKILKIWFFILPSRFPILNMVGLFLLMKWVTNDQPHYLFLRELGGAKSWGNFFYMLFFQFPFFWSFFCLWGDVKMISRRRNNNSLDAVIAYRNGQMSNKTAQEAFGIYKDTAHLDLMKANESNPNFEKIIQGFNIEFNNRPAPDAFAKFIEKGS